MVSSFSVLMKSAYMEGFLEAKGDGWHNNPEIANGWSKSKAKALSLKEDSIVSPPEGYITISLEEYNALVAYATILAELIQKKEKENA